MEFDSRERLACRKHLLLIGLFFALLWLPTLDEIFHIDRAVAYNEKRLLAHLPQFEFRLDGLKNYLDGLQACFNDRFGFRLCLLRWYNGCTHLLFGNRTGSKVIRGTHGWLFYSGEDMIQQYRGVHPFTPQDLLDWQRLLEQRRDWLAERGIKYLFVVAPDKQSVYPEELPSWLVKATPETRLDQFVAYMRTNSTVEILDLRSTLREARRTNETYLKTDTHWNFFGGFIASKAIMRELSISPLSLDSFDIAHEKHEGGDLACMFGLDPSQIPEDNFFHFTPKATLPHLESSDHCTKGSGAPGRMIVFHDSFGLGLKPFLGFSLGEVTYIPQENLDLALIEKSKPTVVVSEMVERFFNIRDPKMLRPHSAPIADRTTDNSRIAQQLQLEHGGDEVSQTLIIPVSSSLTNPLTALQVGLNDVASQHRPQVRELTGDLKK